MSNEVSCPKMSRIMEVAGGLATRVQRRPAAGFELTENSLQAAPLPYNGNGSHSRKRLQFWESVDNSRTLECYVLKAEKTTFNRLGGNYEK